MPLKIKAALLGDTSLAALTKRVASLKKIMKGKKELSVGLPNNSMPYPDGTDVIAVGAIHEFGGEIQNPGGVPYGYRTEADAEEGKVRFLKQGEGFLVLGETAPHLIKIPERSFLRSAVAENREEWLALARKIYEKAIEKNQSPTNALRILGEVMQIAVQKKIDTGPFEPNSPAYAKIKTAAGKTKPLIVTGHLRGSIRWVLEEV